jgi:hypothetical protein
VVAATPTSAAGDRAFGKAVKQLPVPALGIVAVGE